MKVIVLIADIISSKQINDRNTYQANLNRELAKISESSNGILSPYTITLGDEFQAVYKTGENILKDIIEILTKVYPTKVRFAIGLSEIHTNINTEKSIGMDGPAFHIARDGIESLKQTKHSIIQFYGDLFLSRDLLNSGLGYVTSIVSDWKQNTLIIFNELMKNKTVKEIIPIVGISQRGVYKTIKTQSLLYLKDYFHSIEKEILKMKEIT